MKRRIFAGVITLSALLVGWMLWITYLNTRAAFVTVKVKGNVDEVLFYQIDRPEAPVGHIVTNGLDTTETLALKRATGFSPLFQSPPAKYYFVARAGDQEVRGRVICCTVGAMPAHDTLLINGLDNWQSFGQ